VLLVPPPTRQRPPSTDGGFQIAWNSADGVTDEDVKKDAAEGKPNEDISVSPLPRGLSESGRRRIQLFWQPLTRYEVELRTYCKSIIVVQLQSPKIVFVLLRVSHALLWPPYGIGQAITFLPCGFFLSSSSSSFFFSSPNLTGRRLDVYHTSTHAVALVRI